jgi:membrane-bound serine protease (ClpP class)
MVLIICLLLAGVLLLGSEVFLPSGLIGTVGGACVVVGICVAYSRYGPLAGIAAGVAALVAVVAVIIIELKLLPRTSVGRKMFNHAASAGKAVNTGAATAPELIGKRGTAATTFAPTGLAEIDGHEYEAASLDGLLNRGDPLVVAGRDPYKLLVKKAPADEVSS